MAREHEGTFLEKAYADIGVMTQDGRIYSPVRKQVPWELRDTLLTDGELDKSGLPSLVWFKRNWTHPLGPAACGNNQKTQTAGLTGTRE